MDRLTQQRDKIYNRATRGEQPKPNTICREIESKVDIKRTLDNHKY